MPPKKKAASSGEPVRKSSRILEKKQKYAGTAAFQPSPPSFDLRRALPTELFDEIIGHAAYYSTELDISESCLPALRAMNIDVPRAEVEVQEQERREALQVRRAIMGVDKRWQALGRKWFYRTLTISDHNRKSIPSLLGRFLATNEGRLVRRVDVECEITPETIEGTGAMIRGLVQCCPNVLVLHERVRRSGWTGIVFNDIPKQASFEIPFAMALGNRKYQTVQLASFTSDALRALGYRYSIDMLWRLPHIRVLSLNSFRGWNLLPDRISLDPRPPKFYRTDLREIRRKARESGEKQELAEARGRHLEERQQKKKREWTPGADGRHHPKRVRQSPIPSNKSSTITDSSDLIEEDGERLPQPEVNEAEIPQTRVSNSALAQKGQGGEPNEYVDGGGEVPDMMDEGVENDVDGKDRDDDEDEEEEEEAETEEEVSEEEEEEEIIHTLSFPELHTLDMTLSFSDHSLTAQVYKYVDLWYIPSVTQLSISIPSAATFPERIFHNLGDRLKVLSLKRLGLGMTGLTPVALPKVEHLIICVRGCEARWDRLFIMKEVKTVTLHTSNIRVARGLTAFLEPEHSGEEDDKGIPPRWQLWLEKRAWIKIALRGCADVAVMPALTRVVMKGFPFVEIAGCGREDYIKFYEDYFAMLHARGVAVDGEERISWEDAKEIARIRAEEEAARKTEEEAARKAHAEEEAILAAERAAVESQSAMEVDGARADADDPMEVDA